MRLCKFLLLENIACKNIHLLRESMPPKPLEKFEPLEAAILELPGIVQSEGAAYPEGNIFTSKPVYCIFIEQEGSTKGLAFLAKLMSRRYYGKYTKG